MYQIRKSALLIEQLNKERDQYNHQQVTDLKKALAHMILHSFYAVHNSEKCIYFFLFEQKSSRFLISMLYISVFRFSQFHESSLFRAIHAYNLKLPFSDGIYKTSLGISSVLFIVLSAFKKISRVLFLHKNNYLFLLYLLSFLLHC